MSLVNGGGVGGGAQGGVLWEPKSWAMSNSDNSGGKKRPPESGSNSPTGPLASAASKPPRDGGSKSSSSKGGGGGGGGGGKRERKGGSGGGGGGGGPGDQSDDHGIHIWTERERRKKMRNMFSSLHALLPHLSSKADKSTIVDEAVSHIKTLQQTLQRLQKQKLERMRGAVLSLEETPPPPPAAIQSQGTESREAFLAEQGKNWAPSTSCPTAITIPPRYPVSFQTWSSPNVVLSVTGEDAHINICAAKKPGLLSTIVYVLDKHKLEVVSAHVSSDQFRSTYMVHARAAGASDQFHETLMIEEVYKLAVGEIILWLS